ncbi:MAG: hypothetical protein J1D77_05685 [Muribaculaceae bacterium]|nr:hypothetical protein [Muribaculaceae bacterium]
MMKIYRIIGKALCAATLIAGAAACSDDLELRGIAGDGNSLNLTLSYPYYIETQLGTRAFEDNASVYVAYYNGATFIKQIALSNGQKEFSSDNNTITVSVPKETGATSLHFIVGYDPQLPSSKNLSSIVFDNADAAAGYLWGNYEVNGGTKSVKLLHPIAQISVKEELDNFTLLGYEVYGLSTKGSLTTKDYNMNPNSVTPVDGNSFTQAPSSVGNSIADRNVFETANVAGDDGFGSIRIIVKGQYGDDQTPYYYPLFFGHRVDSEGEATDGFSEDPETFSDISLVDIIRNHKYILNISYARAAGWSSLDEALAAKPDNRLAVEITDQNDNISDIIACRDYALGVQASQLSVSGAAETFSIEVVHTYNEGNTLPSVSISYPSGTDPWISSNSVTAKGSADMFITGEATKKGKKYSIDLSLKQNTSKTDSHSAYITIKVGDLSRTVTLTQLPRDYMRGEDRTVILVVPGDSEPVTTDYFAWIDQTDPSNYCFGVRPQDNQGEVRNKGLIFSPVEVYSDQISYLIPKKYGDVISDVTGFNIEIFTSGTGNFAQYNNNYWEVKAKSFPGDLGKTVMMIQNPTDGDIEYDLYISGFFHELTSEMISSYANPAFLVNPGWYYYEFVKTAAGSFILDRNIGAPTNAPYISTNIGYKGNKGAIGGYFKIATERYKANVTEDDNFSYWEKRYYSDKTILETLGLPENKNGLHIPTKGDIGDLQLTLGHPASETDAEANVSSVIGTGIEGTSVTAYIPHSGYYEDNTLKLPTRANLWTSTIYCEPQGFHPNVDKFSNINFGFWYYYLDAQAKDDYLKSFSQIRCTDATADDFSDALIYRYMPIRLVWSTANDSDEQFGNGSGDSGNDSPKYETPSKGTDIFLRGSFNNWKTDNPAWEFNVVTANSEYLSDYVEIPNGANFKIGGKDGWDIYNFGGTNSDQNLQHNVERSLFWNDKDLFMQNDFHGYIRFKHNGRSNSTIIAETVEPFKFNTRITFYVTSNSNFKINNLSPRYVKYWFDDEENSTGYFYLNHNVDDGGNYYVCDDWPNILNPIIKNDKTYYKIYYRLATDLNGSNQTRPYIITKEKCLGNEPELRYYINKLD